MYSLVITGIGAEGGLFFSLKKIIFGVVDTGKCAVDSLIVSNQCGANATLDIPTLSPPFSVLSPTAAQISLGTNEQQTIIYQYCPTTEGADSAIHILDTTRITLRGIGKVHPPLPTVTFSVPAKKNVTEGTTFDYSLNVDEISANASIESFFVVLRYDPVVIAPLFITSQNGWQITGNETKPGRYEISGSANTATLTSGKIADIKILPYLAMRDTASVIFESAITVPEASVTKHSGSIFVLHCGELPKNIIIAGDYEVGDPSPNPMSTHVSIPLKLGADGLLTINVANTNGDIVLQKILPRMKKGKQTLQLDLSSLVSGSYFITFDSWGWRETRSVLITK